MQLHNSVVVDSRYYINSYFFLLIHTPTPSFISFYHLSFLHTSHNHINTSRFPVISVLVFFFLMATLVMSWQ
jgi:hypothetical protein